MKRKREKRDYSEGYLPKLRYWRGKIIEAFKLGDDERASYALDRYNGFAKSHIDRYPEIPIEF